MSRTRTLHGCCATQEKRVKGVTYRSQDAGVTDRRVLDANFHRLLSNISTQQLICSRLFEDGLRAHVKPISVNAQAGDQWVSTTTILVTIAIWGEAHDSSYDAPHGLSRHSSRFERSASMDGQEPTSPMLRLHTRSISTSGWSLASS